MAAADSRVHLSSGYVGCENEGTKFWTTILNGLKNRDIEDNVIACTDNVMCFDTAIHDTFPQTESKTALFTSCAIPASMCPTES